MKRKVINDNLCEQCKDQREDVIYALYHCPKLRGLWSDVQLRDHSCLKQATSFIDLIGCVFADNRDPTLFSMVAWAIWNRRNNLRLGKPAAPLNELVTQAQDRLREFQLYNFSTIIPVGRPPTNWQAPSSNTYEVNFDGALFAAENRAGLGMVIRNSKGQVMLSLSEKTSLPYTAIEVEALAARRALKLALETGFQQITLEGDSQILISALVNNTHSLSSFGHILKDIQFLASCFSKINYSHVRRHCNTVAHSLARRAISLSQLQVWMEDVPPDILPVFQADLTGLPT